MFTNREDSTTFREILTLRVRGRDHLLDNRDGKWYNVYKALLVAHVKTSRRLRNSSLLSEITQQRSVMTSLLCSISVKKPRRCRDGKSFWPFKVLYTTHWHAGGSDSSGAIVIHTTLTHWCRSIGSCWRFSILPKGTSTCSRGWGLNHRPSSQWTTALHSPDTAFCGVSGQKDLV